MALPYSIFTSYLLDFRYRSGRFGDRGSRSYFPIPPPHIPGNRTFQFLILCADSVQHVFHAEFFVVVDGHDARGIDDIFDKAARDVVLLGQKIKVKFLTRKFRRQALNDLEEPAKLTSASTATIKSGIKYGILGGVLGGFMIVFFVCVVFVMSDKVYSSKELRRRSNVKVLGVFPVSGNKPGHSLRGSVD